MSNFSLAQHFKENMTGVGTGLSWRSTSLSVDCEKRMPNFENGEPWEEGERLLALKAVHNALISVNTKNFLYEFVVGVVVKQNEVDDKLEIDPLNANTGFTTHQSYLHDYPATLKIIGDTPVDMNPSWLGDADNKDRVIDRTYYQSEEYELRKSIVMLLNEMLISTSKESHNRKVHLQNMVELIHKQGVSINIEKAMQLASQH